MGYLKRGVLDKTQQHLLLLKIINDLKKRVGPHVILECLKTPNSYHILNPTPLHYKNKHLVGWEGVQPRVGCLLVAIPHEILASANASKMPGSWLLSGGVYGRGCERHWEICDANFGPVYWGLIYALEQAYKYITPPSLIQVSSE